MSQADPDNQLPDKWSSTVFLFLTSNFRIFLNSSKIGNYADGLFLIIRPILSNK